MIEKSFIQNLYGIGIQMTGGVKLYIYIFHIQHSATQYISVDLSRNFQ